MLLIPGNNSGTGILQQLMDSDGVGILFEAEADTLVTAIQSEYGKWSDCCATPSTTTPGLQPTGQRGRVP